MKKLTWIVILTITASSIYWPLFGGKKFNDIAKNKFEKESEKKYHEYLKTIKEKNELEFVILIQPLKETQFINKMSEQNFKKVIHSLLEKHWYNAIFYLTQIIQKNNLILALISELNDYTTNEITTETQHTQHDTRLSEIYFSFFRKKNKNYLEIEADSIELFYNALMSNAKKNYSITIDSLVQIVSFFIADQQCRPFLKKFFTPEVYVHIKKYDKIVDYAIKAYIESIDITDPNEPKKTIDFLLHNTTIKLDEQAIAFYTLKSNASEQTALNIIKNLNLQPQSLDYKFKWLTIIDHQTLLLKYFIDNDLINEHSPINDTYSKYIQEHWVCNCFLSCQKEIIQSLIQKKKWQELGAMTSSALFNLPFEILIESDVDPLAKKIFFNMYIKNQLNLRVSKFLKKSTNRPLKPLLDLAKKNKNTTIYDLIHSKTDSKSITNFLVKNLVTLATNNDRDTAQYNNHNYIDEMLKTAGLIIHPCPLTLNIYYQILKEKKINSDLALQSIVNACGKQSINLSDFELKGLTKIHTEYPQETKQFLHKLGNNDLQNYWADDFVNQNILNVTHESKKQLYKKWEQLNDLFALLHKSNVHQIKPTTIKKISEHFKNFKESEKIIKNLIITNENDTFKKILVQFKNEISSFNESMKNNFDQQKYENIVNFFSKPSNNEIFLQIHNLIDPELLYNNSCIEIFSLYCSSKLLNKNFITTIKSTTKITENKVQCIELYLKSLNHNDFIEIIFPKKIEQSLLLNSHFNNQKFFETSANLIQKQKISPSIIEEFLIHAATSNNRVILDIITAFEKNKIAINYEKIKNILKNHIANMVHDFSEQAPKKDTKKHHVPKKFIKKITPPPSSKPAELLKHKKQEPVGIVVNLSETIIDRRELPEFTPVTTRKKTKTSYGHKKKVVKTKERPSANIQKTVPQSKNSAPQKTPKNNITIKGPEKKWVVESKKILSTATTLAVKNRLNKQKYQEIKQALKHDGVYLRENISQGLLHVSLEETVEELTENEKIYQEMKYNFLNSGRFPATVPTEKESAIDFLSKTSTKNSLNALDLAGNPSSLQIKQDALYSYALTMRNYELNQYNNNHPPLKNPKNNKKIKEEVNATFALIISSKRYQQLFN